MTVSRVYLGELDKAREKYIHAALTASGTINKDTVIINYVGMTPDSIERVKEMVAKRVDFERVVVHQASPAIATNSGPETFGVLYEVM